MDELINLVFGADIDAACGFVKNDHVGITLEPLGEYDFLLVAAG